eukprot:TRINITY_DN10565_c0_g1_i7.p1 TRINITY_DN10565_c0_g1~~TRINITY_DN10565_c0_g1_i7.p1  ORF type:complete len:129 (+),score=17.72 TRINITY_DN10565_c0_g1_i7:214-600(+)
MEGEMDRGYKRNHLRNFVSTDNIFRFGADVVKQFLDANGMEMMVRSHETAANGIDTFANSQLVSITSCTNYCGVLKNPACILMIKKTFEIVPKILLPAAETGKFPVWIDTEETLKRRPLTPPRQTHSS